MKTGIAKRIPAIVLGVLLITLLLSVNALAAEAGSWTTMAPMSVARSSFQTEVVNGKIYAIGGHPKSIDNPTSSVEVYDPGTNIWTMLAPMSTPRNQCQTEAINGKIYVMGGYYQVDGAASYLSSAEVYDPGTNTWTTIAPMSVARAAFQTAVLDGKIYAFGGTSSSGILSSVEVYDPSTNTWTKLASMTTERVYSQTAVINGKIYAFGGFKTENTKDGLISSYMSSTEVYNPATNTWTALASMKTGRSDFQSETIDGKIYAIGGRNSSDSYLSSAEVYDPTSNTWTELASMSGARFYFSAQVSNGKIYAIGGYNDSGIVSSAEEYDPHLNTWSSLNPMTVARYALQTALVGGKIYALGGDSTKSSVEVYMITSESTAPTAPTLSATAGDKQVNLSWTAVDGAASYHVYRSTTSGGPYTKIETGVTGTTDTDSSVTNGTTYYYVVTAVDSSGTESAYSNEASATPASASPVYRNATIRITMVTGETKEYNVTAAVAQDFVAWVNSKASNSPVYAFPKTYDLGPYHARTEYVAFSNISSFEILMY